MHVYTTYTHHTYTIHTPLNTLYTPSIRPNYTTTRQVLNRRRVCGEEDTLHPRRAGEKQPINTVKHPITPLNNLLTPYTRFIRAGRWVYPRFLRGGINGRCEKAAGRY